MVLWKLLYGMTRARHTVLYSTCVQPCMICYHCVSHCKILERCILHSGTVRYATSMEKAIEYDVTVDLILT